MIHTNLTATRIIWRRGLSQAERAFAVCRSDVTIEAIAAKGDGIAKKEGFVIFVPGTQVGDKVRIRVTKVMRKVAALLKF